MQYNEQTKQFEDDNGNAVEIAAVIALIDKLKTVGKRDAKRLAARLEKGEITAKQFEAAMLELLIASHIVAASVGRGGIDRMDAEDWAKVERKVEWQEGYLSKWTKKIIKGVVAVTAIGIASRAFRYLSSPFISFSSAFRTAQIEPVLSGPGVAGRTTPPDNGGNIPRGVKIPTLARLIQNSKEGCDECNADAAEGWMPVEDMGEIGSRICQDFCLCSIEFSE